MNRPPKIIKRADRIAPPDWTLLTSQANDAVRVAKMMYERALAHQAAIDSMSKIALKPEQLNKGE